MSIGGRTCRSSADLRTHGRPGSRAASDRSPDWRGAGGVWGLTTSSLSQGRTSAVSIITILVLLATYLVRRVV